MNETFSFNLSLSTQATPGGSCAYAYPILIDKQDILQQTPANNELPAMMRVRATAK